MRSRSQTEEFKDVSGRGGEIYWSEEIGGGHGGRVVTLSPPTAEGRGSVPGTTSSGKAGSCLPLVGSFTVQKPWRQLYVLVSSAHKTTRLDVQCVESDIKTQINKWLIKLCRCPIKIWPPMKFVNGYVNICKN